ncbi:MAG: hypothetical protein AB7O96_09730 [Pseudobdellovibrionaceae bacterium]
MNRKFVLLTFLVSLPLCLMAYQNCAKANFSKDPAGDAALVEEVGAPADAPVEVAGTDGGPQDPPKETPPTPSENNEEFKVSFSSQSAPLDMVWVIDNSGSMAAEAALVRDNFSSFLTTLNQSSNFRFLLISGASGTRGVALPSGVNSGTHMQIDKAVGSTNGPQLLLSEIKKVPTDFFRVDSKKVVVFVTDDNSNLSASHIYGAFSTDLKWVQNDVSVFSFIGIDQATSPCLAAPGEVYKSLASTTSGHVYDICQTDWSAHFSDLTSTAISQAVRRFTVRSAIAEIIDVKVDGQVIAANLYSFSDKTVTLVDSVNLAENSTVVIRYK